MKVHEILAIKGNALFTVSSKARLGEAVATMVQEDIGSLVVFEEGALVGLLTFREALRAIAQAGAAWEEVVVGDAMVRNPMTVAPQTEVNALREQMVAVHQRYFPVVDEGVLLGVLSFHDVAKAVLEEQSFENRALKAFIRGMQS
jgi:CBS domain-containing protein